MLIDCSDKGGGVADDAGMFHISHCDRIAIPILLYATMDFSHFRKKIEIIDSTFNRHS